MSFDYSLVKKAKSDFKQISKILRDSDKLLKLAKIGLTTSSEGSFSLSYEAMLKITLALMLSTGLRPKIRLGHHKTLVNFSIEILGEKFLGITKTYRDMRTKRNKVIYDSGSVSKSEAGHAYKIAKQYLRIVEEKITKDNPQQKLWKP